MRCTRYLDAGDDREMHDDAHRVSCPDCQEQWDVEHELRQLFQKYASPELSLGFRRELRARIAAERRQRQGRRWRLMVMRCYWAAAALACSVILVRLELPTQDIPESTLALLGVVVASALLPVLVLLRGFRVSLVDLIWGTLDRFSSP